MKPRTVSRMLFLSAAVVLAASFRPVFAADVDPSALGSVKATSESPASRLAPGEFLPFSVKLVNFGSEKRVDIIINYEILDSKNKLIYSESETVAVETTASFVKRIQLSYTMEPGIYTAQTALTYPGQDQPAISRFPFKVEKKIGDFFVSDLALYATAGGAILITILAVVFLFSWSRRKGRYVMYDYSKKPKDQVIYYEMLSDIVSQMRLKIGDRALEIAKEVPNLQINPDNGMILDIQDDPAKIIALLVLRYEKESGKKLSFGLRPKI